MNQIDILITRKKFQAMGQKLQEDLDKIPDIPIDTPKDKILYARSIRRQEQLNISKIYKEKTKNLCRSLFGSDLSMYSTDYADPLEVLDWIEHFMNKKED